MTQEEREKFVESIDVVTRGLIKRGLVGYRTSETRHHIVGVDTDILIEVKEGARVITIPNYEKLPLELKDLVEYGRKAGYRVHRDVPLDFF